MDDKSAVGQSSALDSELAVGQSSALDDGTFAGKFIIGLTGNIASAGTEDDSQFGLDFDPS